MGALTDALNLFFTCRCYFPRITRKLKAELAGNKVTRKQNTPHFTHIVRIRG